MSAEQKTTQKQVISLYKIILPTEQYENFRADYKEMRNIMIHGMSEDFKRIIERINTLIKN